MGQPSVSSPAIPALAKSSTWISTDVSFHSQGTETALYCIHKCAGFIVFWIQFLKLWTFSKQGTQTHTHTFFACIFLPGPSICWMNEQMNRVHRAWAGKTQTPNSTKEKKRKEKVTFLEQHSRFFHTWEPSVSQYFLKASVRSTLALWWFCFPVLSVSYPTHLLH